MEEKDMIYNLDKKKFYENLRKRGRYNEIFFFMPIDENENRYEMMFDWTDKLPNGEFNPIMTAKLIDKRKTRRERQIAEINFNCIEKGVITDYKLYKFINGWIETTILQNQDIWEMIVEKMKDGLRRLC